MQPPDANFIPGLDLSESFYHDVFAPILREDFAGLQYAAALIGDGSEVLGFDTKMSADHDWGPRVMLFLGESDLVKYKSAITNALHKKLPEQYKGYATACKADAIVVTSIRDFLAQYLGFDIGCKITTVDWLTIPEQKLLALTSGRVFFDQIGLEDVRKRLAYYPHDVWLYLLAAIWTRIEQEGHLMSRAGSAGDEIGSALIASRLVRDLMRLCFLMEKRYAPYPKWFGTAFKKLEAATILAPLLQRVLVAPDWQERQEFLISAYQYVARLHNDLGITEPLPTEVALFFDRPFYVISTGAYSRAIVAQITDAKLQELAKKPIIGSIDQFSDSTDLLHDPMWRPALVNLYG